MRPGLGIGGVLWKTELQASTGFTRCDKGDGVQQVGTVVKQDPDL